MADFWIKAGNDALTFFSVTTALLFFLAGIVLVVVLKLAGLMKRKNRWHGLFVKLYYLYIPILCFVCGLAWGAVRAVDLSLTSACEAVRKEIIVTSTERAEALGKNIAERFPANAQVSLRDITTVICRQYVEEYTAAWNPQDLKGFSFILRPLAEAVKGGMATALADAVEGRLVKKVAALTRLEPETVGKLWKMDIVEAARGGLVYEILIQQIRASIDPLYSTVRAVFILFLLPVLLETAVSMYFLRRARRLAAPA